MHLRRGGAVVVKSNISLIAGSTSSSAGRASRRAHCDDRLRPDLALQFLRVRERYLGAAMSGAER